MNTDKRYLLAWEDDVSIFLFLALSSTFLLGMVAGALIRRIVGAAADNNRFGHT